jgi:tetratricopeptide (TPR) repeat protein
MKTFIVVMGLLLSVITDAVQADTLLPCEKAYQSGIELFNAGKYQAASESFFEAITLAPGPETEPGEYVPYIYLSAARFELGHTREARDALIQSQIYGVAPETDTGKLLLDRYAVDIMSAPLDEPGFVSTPQSSPVTGESLSLSGNEVELIRAQVLTRCAVFSKVEKNKLPWYFHYEFGVHLMEAGDPKRAIDAFVLGANVKEDPHRDKRMYGMWYIDYLPYYQIALAHSKLGDWESAYAAIQTSENFGEFSPTDSDYETFLSLDQLIRSNLEVNDS